MKFRHSLLLLLFPIACVGAEGELDPGLKGAQPPPTTSPEALKACTPVKLSTDDSDVEALKLVEADGLFGLAYVDHKVLKFSIINPEGGMFTTQELSVPSSDAHLLNAAAFEDRFEVLWSDGENLTWSTLNRAGALLSSETVEGWGSITLDHSISTPQGWWLIQGDRAQRYTDPRTIEQTYTWPQETGRPFAWLEQDGAFVRAITAEVMRAESPKSMVKVTFEGEAREFETDHLVTYEKGQLIQGAEGATIFLTAQTEPTARRVDILMYDLQRERMHSLFMDIAFYGASVKVARDSEAHGVVWNMAEGGWNDAVMFSRINQDGVVLDNTKVARGVVARSAYLTDMLYKADAGLFTIVWTDVRDNVPDDLYPMMYKKRQVYMMHIRDGCPSLP